MLCVGVIYCRKWRFVIGCLVFDLSKYSDVFIILNQLSESWGARILRNVWNHTLYHILAVLDPQQHHCENRQPCIIRLLVMKQHSDWWRISDENLVSWYPLFHTWRRQNECRKCQLSVLTLIFYMHHAAKCKNKQLEGNAITRSLTG